MKKTQNFSSHKKFYAILYSIVNPEFLVILLSCLNPLVFLLDKLLNYLAFQSVDLLTFLMKVIPGTRRCLCFYEIIDLFDQTLCILIYIYNYIDNRNYRLVILSLLIRRCVQGPLEMNLIISLEVQLT